MVFFYSNIGLRSNIDIVRLRGQERGVQMEEKKFSPYKFSVERLLGMVMGAVGEVARQGLVMNLKEGRYEYRECVARIKGDQVVFVSMPLSGFSADGVNYFFSDRARFGKLEKYLFDTFQGFSKNRQKKYAEIERRLLEGFSYKRAEDFILFLQAEFHFFLITTYGFDGGTIRIKKIGSMSKLGEEKHKLRMKIRENEDRIVRLHEEIASYEKENEYLCSKLGELGR